MIKINLFCKVVCAGCGLVIKDGAAYPVSHSLCSKCKEISEAEISAYLEEEKSSWRKKGSISLGTLIPIFGG